VRTAQWAIRAVPVAIVLLTASGCGFAHALAHPEAQTGSAQTGSAQTAATDAAPATPDPDQPRTIVDGDLLTSAGSSGGRLVVRVDPVRSGLVPPVHDASPCHFDGPSLQYLPVEFATPPGLAAHVEVSTGPATPADIGDVGIFVESNGGGQVYCTDYPPLPTRDRFWNQMGARTIRAWVVLDKAVTPATPQGRAEVFPTLQLRISHFRMLSGATGGGPLVPGALGGGAVCPDDSGAICVPLG
jgi:hypothetical protein